MIPNVEIFATPHRGPDTYTVVTSGISRAEATRIYDFARTLRPAPPAPAAHELDFLMPSGAFISYDEIAGCFLLCEETAVTELIRSPVTRRYQLGTSLARPETDRVRAAGDGDAARFAGLDLP